MLTEEIRAELFRMQDEAYRDFRGKLLPTVDPENSENMRSSLSGGRTSGDFWMSFRINILMKTSFMLLSFQR